ncbi:hypothetical protein NVP1244A_178 [Vibrio phage 1.244.A._10N.261.54.C3]|nr:hypothetical protein NVP1244A_178 [Vibrio phage 1.244.A._10N.261.54.C3]AUR98806.1 hypothetical protein NVP1255O_178 [Vibrio phage 1.255.O._10N.286.45.F1]
MTLKIKYMESFPRWALNELGASESMIDYLQHYVERVMKYAVGSFDWEVTTHVDVKIQKGATFRMRRGTLKGVYGLHKVPCQHVTYGVNRSGIDADDIKGRLRGKTTIVINIGSAYYHKYVRAIEAGVSETTAMNSLRGELAETIFHEMAHSHQYDVGHLSNSKSNGVWYHNWCGWKSLNIRNLSYESYRALPWEVEARLKAKTLCVGFGRHIKIHNMKTLSYNDLQKLLK